MFIQNIVDPINDEIVAKFVAESGAFETAMPADPKVISAQPTYRLTLLLQFLVRDFQLSSADNSSRFAEEVHCIYQVKCISKDKSSQ